MRKIQITEARVRITCTRCHYTFTYTKHNIFQVPGRKYTQVECPKCKVEIGTGVLAKTEK